MGVNISNQRQNKLKKNVVKYGKIKVTDKCNQLMYYCENVYFKQICLNIKEAYLGVSVVILIYSF